MTGLRRRMTVSGIVPLVVVATALFGQVARIGGAGAAPVARAALAPGSINNVLVIELENEDAADTYGPGSVATYLNGTLVPKGELLENYYATGHVSLDNYIAEISGQAPTPLTDSDCNVTGYSNVTPGTDDPNTAKYPGQVDGNGCVYPAPTATTTGAPTIADQLDAADPPNPTTHVASWREYAEDMGNDPTRDGGVTDPLGGTDCAHPTVGGTDGAAIATATDQYATRHDPFVYFHSIIDNTAECDANVVPLGKSTVGTPSTFNGVNLPDTFTGHLANDLSSEATTPKFGFITPNLCDDGHDGTCAGTNVEGGKTGGLTALDLWLKHWMPLIMASPSYQSGQMLVVLTSDEGDDDDTTACCNEQPGPNWAFPGHSPLLGAAPTTPGADPGGGRIGTLLLNSSYIQPGTVDTTGFYNHYSALRSYEDLLGLTTGGTDGAGHLGFAAAAGLTPFGQDVFQPDEAPTISTNPQSQSVVTDGTLTFTAAADITTPIIQWQASVNGGASWINLAGATNPSLTSGSLNNFENGWQVRAVFTNYVGSAASAAATITVTPPTTAVVVPSSNATVSGSVALDAVASPGTTTVRYQVTGGALSNAVIATATPTLYGWLAKWDTTTVPNGTYTLQSVATSGGLTGTSPGITITVNNPPPTTAVVLPSNNASLAANAFLDAVASSGVTKVQYQLTGGTLTNALIATATPTIYGWLASWNSTTVANGQYTLQSVASYAGGVSGTSAPITITVGN
jgi:phosphatidylinositol-3-phosphatase